MTEKVTVEEKILEAVSETVENLAFEEIVSEGVISGIPSDLPEMLWSVIEVEDPPIGLIGLLIPKSLMTRFTEAIHSLPAGELGMPLILVNLAEMLTGFLRQ